jgi:hypothetical protein
MRWEKVEHSAKFHESIQPAGLWSLERVDGVTGPRGPPKPELWCLLWVRRESR